MKGYAVLPNRLQHNTSLNLLYTDYSKVAKKFGFDRMEVLAEMAKAFIHDKDAEPGKVKTYYECIAKEDE